MSTKLVKYFMYLFLIALGVVIGIAIRHYNNIPITETINIIDVATLVVTIFLAVYIPEVLDRKQQVKHEKKSLIEERIENLQILYKNINRLVQQAQPNQKNSHDVEHILDICQHRLITIEQLFHHTGFKISFEQNLQELIVTCQEHKKLLLTKQADNENDFIYPLKVRSQEEVLYNKIDTMTCLLIFKLSDV